MSAQKLTEAQRRQIIEAVVSKLTGTDWINGPEFLPWLRDILLHGRSGLVEFSDEGLREYAQFFDVPIDDVEETT